MSAPTWAWGGTDSRLCHEGDLTQNVSSNIANQGTWSYKDLISAMNRIDEIVVHTETHTFAAGTEMDGLCNKFSRLRIEVAVSNKSKTRTRVGWLLSRLPPLLIERDPSMTGSMLRKFELFMRLPAEIRIMIWDLVASVPRYAFLRTSIFPWYLLLRTLQKGQVAGMQYRTLPEQLCALELQRRRSNSPSRYLADLLRVQDRSTWAALYHGQRSLAICRIHE